MQRSAVNVARDKRMFAHTADRTRKLNINPRVYRGGIRL